MFEGATGYGYPTCQDYAKAQDTIPYALASAEAAKTPIQVTPSKLQDSPWALVGSPEGAAGQIGHELPELPIALRVKAPVSSENTRDPTETASNASSHAG